MQSYFTEVEDIVVLRDYEHPENISSPEESWLLSSSLLEEDPTKNSSNRHGNTAPGNNVNIFEGEMVNSQNVGGHGQSIESSKYLQTQAFSPSTDWIIGEVLTACQMPKVELSKKQYKRDLNSIKAKSVDAIEIDASDEFQADLETDITKQLPR